MRTATGLPQHPTIAPAGSTALRQARDPGLPDNRPHG